MSNRLVSIDTAAERLALGRSSTKALIYAGLLRTVRVGKRRLVPEDAISAFILDLERDAGGESARLT